MHTAAPAPAPAPVPSSVRRPVLRSVRRPAAALAPVLAAALLATATGCSSGSGGGSKALDSLRHMRADTDAAKQVTYVDEVRMRKLSASDPKRYAHIAQPVSPLLSSYEPGPWGLSLKAGQIDTAVDTSVAGHWDGSFDAAAVTASLKSHGYASTEKNGTQVWKRSGSSSGPAFVISDHEIRYSTQSTKFSAADPGHGHSLADISQYRLVTECLGDVYRADFTTLSTEDPVLLSALGQQDDGSGNTEVLCAAVKDRASADKLAAKLRAVVKDKAPRFDGTEVTVDKGDHPVVRAAVPDTASQRPGRLFISDVDLWMAVGEM